MDTAVIVLGLTAIAEAIVIGVMHYTGVQERVLRAEEDRRERQMLVNHIQAPEAAVLSSLDQLERQQELEQLAGQESHDRPLGPSKTENHEPHLVESDVERELAARGIEIP